MGPSRVSLRLRMPGDRRMRRVLVAYGLCDLIEFATWMAVVLVAYQRGGAVLIGIASVAMLVPAIVVVPLVAGFGDRMPRGRALSLTHAGVGATSLVMCALLLMDAPFWSIVLGGAIQTVALSLVQPMHYAALPFLAVRPGDLVAANGLSSFLDGATLFLGFVIAGLLSDVVGPWAVLLACGVAGLVAAWLTTGLGIAPAARSAGNAGGPGEANEPDEPGELRAAVQGFVALRGNWGALALLALLGCTFFVDGANEPLTITFNAEVLGLGDATAGLLAGAYGVGLAIGGATQAGLAHRSSLAPVVLAGSAILGLFWLSAAFLGRLGPAFVMLTVAGIGASLIIVSARTLLQRTTDNLVLARVLAVQESVKTSGQTVGAVVGPAAIAAMGPSRAFIPVGLIVILTGVLSHRKVKELEATATVRIREIRVLERIPFLAALPPYELEHLAQSVRWRWFPAGIPVVTQGEPGDAFYIVVDGQLSVTVDGRLRPHTLNPGDGFGEIAMLHRVPRTATVTAMTDCELLMIDAAQFLAAVTSSADGTALAREISDQRLSNDRDASA